MGPQHEGASPSIDELIDRYGMYIHAIVRRVSRCDVAEDVEEAVANVAVEIWRARERYDPARGDIKDYIAAIARAEGMRLYTRCHRRKPWLPLREDIAGGTDPGDEAAARERRAEIRQALYALDDRDIFVRRYYLGDSLADIAADMGLTERAVEGRLYRGRKKLRDVLKGVEAHDLAMERGH